MSRITKIISKVVCILIFLIFVDKSIAMDEEYFFTIHAHNLTQYNDYISLSGINETNFASTDTRLSRQGLNRQVLELLLFKKAMLLGGCGCVIEYHAADVSTSHARKIIQVKESKAIAHPIAGFNNDPRLQDKVLLSEPILDEKDFFVGFYTHSDRADVLSLRDPLAITQLRFVAATNWDVDIDVLKKHGFKTVLADSWSSAISMIRLSRADVILQPISTKDDFSFTDGDTNEVYVPIPGIKLKFGTSRRYFVSEGHPDGIDFLNVLNKGITRLRDTGFLDHANRAAGLIDDRVANWQLLD